MMIPMKHFCRRWLVTAWIAVVAVCCVCAGCCVGCRATASVRTLYGLGAVLKLVAYEGMDEWAAHAAEVMAEVTRAVDVEDPTSDLARLNAAAVGEEVIVGELLNEMLATADTAYALTEGGYNAAAYWTVDLWGFSTRDKNAQNARSYDRVEGLPSEEYIAAFAALSSPAMWRRTEGGAWVKTGSVTLSDVTYTPAWDLGGLAKGWVVRRLVAAAADLGITRGYVSFGQSSVALLANGKERDWDLSLRHPRGQEGQTFCTIPTRNRALATSGDYENYFEWQGKRYCHLIDTTTGRPIDNSIRSVTVLGEDAAMCDALATGLAVKGLDFIRAFVQGDYCAAHHVDVVVVYGPEDALQCFTTLDGLRTAL